MTTDSDLKGKSCLITGATDGHGKACAKLLAKRGADVILLGRNENKCRTVQKEIEKKTGRKPDILICNLASRDEINKAAETFLSWNRPLHILLNNAGIVNHKRKETIDGIEETFAVNYLAYFQLTLLLLDTLKKNIPSRIINVSSDMHRLTSLDFDNIQLQQGYSWMKAYNISKLAIVYFTIELAKKLEGTGISVNALDPGPVASNIAGNAGNSITNAISGIIKKIFPSPEKAARTAMYLATSPELSEVTGQYFRFMKLKAPKTDNGKNNTGSKLWDMSLTLTGLKNPIM